MARRAPAGSTPCSRARRWCSSSARAGSARRRSPPRSGSPAAVHQGGKVLVLTVDPARRLADALGVGALGNTASRVPDAAFDRRPASSRRGELWAAMLDTKAGWDELIRRHAPDAQVRDAVLSNPLYQNITSRFVHSHDYLAMEQLHELHATGDYDLVVVDTPPSRNALVRARRAVADGRVLRQPPAALADRARTARGCSRWRRSPSTRSPIGCSAPGSCRTSPTSSCSSRRWRRASWPAAREVEALLGDPRTTFLVVSTLETAPAHEAGLPGPRAASARATTSARSSPTASCRRR